MMRALVVLTAITFCLMAEEAPKGIPARPAAADYAANAQWHNATFAASLIPPKQVEHLFAFDISKTYAVFEVACYADNPSALKISRDAFVIKVNASGDSVRHVEASTVAAAVQRQNQPSLPASHGQVVDTAVGIGYEHGTDPYSGRPVNGVYTAGSVGVGMGTGERQPVPQDSKPGSTYEDRKMLEGQLSAHSLPDGPVDRAVAGYLFFRKSDMKTQSGDTYELEYLADEDASGATHAVTIAVPRKSR